MASVTIRDVAKEAGVSTATVSYVLNGSRRVGDDTRERVLTGSCNPSLKQPPATITASWPFPAWMCMRSCQPTKR